MKMKLITKSLLVLALLFSMSVSAQQKKLSFLSSVQYGTQPDNLSVLVSDNVKDIGDLAAVNAATWIDITKEFKLATDKEPSASGGVSLNKYIKNGNPLYIAIRYLGDAAAKPSQRNWVVKDISVSKDKQATVIPVTDLTVLNSPKNNEGAGWRINKNNNSIGFVSNRSLIKSESWAVIKID